MEYRTLGRTGLKVSEVGFGALELGRDWSFPVGDDFGRPGERAAIRALNAALDAGINFIDTAPAYELSEERIGKAISHRRDEFYLATKVGERKNDGEDSHYDYSGKATAAFIDESLRRMKTDYIDLLQIHSAPMEVIHRGETLGVMKRAQEAGKVRFIGMSGQIEPAIAAVTDGSYDTVQVTYNIVQREAEEELFSLCRENDIGVIIKDGLAAGRLTGKAKALPDEWAGDRERVMRLEEEFVLKGSWHPHYLLPALSVAEVALRWLLANETVSTVIAGSRKIENIVSNASVSDGRYFTAEQVQQIISVAEVSA
jgi:aryl-alcohol dehydrogenase-like predicted oxidoreductase